VKRSAKFLALMLPCCLIVGACDCEKGPPNPRRAIRIPNRRSAGDILPAPARYRTERMNRKNRDGSYAFSRVRLVDEPVWLASTVAEFPNHDDAERFCAQENAKLAADKTRLELLDAPSPPGPSVIEAVARYLKSANGPDGTDGRWGKVRDGWLFTPHAARLFIDDRTGHVRPELSDPDWHTKPETVQTPPPITDGPIRRMGTPREYPPAISIPPTSVKPNP